MACKYNLPEYGERIDIDRKILEESKKMYNKDLTVLGGVDNERITSGEVVLHTPPHEPHTRIQLLDQGDIEKQFNKNTSLPHYVYVVECEAPYSESTIDSIFVNETDAKQYCDKENKNTFGTSYDYFETPLIANLEDIV